MDEAQNGQQTTENKSLSEGGFLSNSSTLKHSSRISKHSFDNLNSLQNTPNMKIISKINSISSLNDKNLEKFSLGSNNNNRFLATKSYIDFLPSTAGSSTFNLESQSLGSAKSLKFNNNSDNSSASAVFWDNFTKPLPAGLSSLPATSTTNLRNTVSSSNLALNINYTDNQTNPPVVPMVLPQKFQFNQPQAQPMLKTSSSGSSVQDEQIQAICSRKSSLQHSNSLINNNHTTSSNFKEISDLSVNGTTNKNNGKLNSSIISGSGNNEMQLQHQNGNQSDQQNKSQPSKWPVVASPHQVMMLYMNKLTPYEHHEIYKYSQIYFIGANAKKRSGTGPNNSDYDNENGSYIHIPHDHVAYRYEVLKIIGKGSFGQVVKAYDHKTREHVALKMVRNEKRFHRQAQEEIRILKHLRGQDKENTFNIIHMWVTRPAYQLTPTDFRVFRFRFDYFVFRNHMCIIFELLHINLYELIKKNKFQGFSLQLVRKFAHSLLQCLDALNKFKIIHCDMKPENILLKQQGRSGIKVTRGAA